MMLYNTKFTKITRYTVYRFFQKLGDVASALQFLVLSKCQDEAFQMAEVRERTFITPSNHKGYYDTIRQELLWSV